MPIVNTSILQSTRSRSFPSGGPNLGKPLCLCPHLAPQMAGRPCPSFYYSLPIAASAVAIPTTRTTNDNRTPPPLSLTVKQAPSARLLPHPREDPALLWPFL